MVVATGVFVFWAISKMKKQVIMCLKIRQSITYHATVHYGIGIWWRKFEPGSGNWLLNKLLKQTFNWRKKYFFLELYDRFH